MDALKHVGSYLLNRLSEKSTWIAIGLLGTALGWKVSPENWNTIALVGMGFCSIIGGGLPARVQEKNVVPSSQPTPLSVSTEAKKQ